MALVQRQSAPRHDAMDVRMEVEFLPPGVERHEHTDLGPQVFESAASSIRFPRQPSSAGRKLCGDCEGRSGRDQWEA